MRHASETKSGDMVYMLAGIVQYRDIFLQCQLKCVIKKQLHMLWILHDPPLLFENNMFDIFALKIYVKAFYTFLCTIRKRYWHNIIFSDVLVFFILVMMYQFAVRNISKVTLNTLEFEIQRWYIFQSSKILEKKSWRN